MAKYTNLTSLFTAIADAIRTKTGDTDTIVADDFPEAIQGIGAGGGSADWDAFIEGREVLLTGSMTTVPDSAFYDYHKVTELYLPKATSIGASSFASCNSLSKAVLPKVTNLGETAFSSSYSLKTVDLSAEVTIGASAFYQCSKLEAVILRSTTMCDVDVSAFLVSKLLDNTGAPTGEGFVYVPTALYESYIADWIPKIITLASIFATPIDEPTATYIATAILRKLEDYTVDGTTTGELDESKI